MSIKPSEYLFIPVRNGRWLRDSQGKPRMYKSRKQAIENLKNHDYDYIHIYVIDDEISREVFEKEGAE
jgi:hypothetical protein